MAHGYRTLQHWDQWLSQQFLGGSVIEAEQQALTPLLKTHYGKHAVLIGVPHQFDLLNTSTLPCHFLLCPLAHHGRTRGFIESALHELPILTGTIDLVVLPHTLEFVDNPRQLLNEACRIVKPEGLLVITGFNPYSFWGLKRFLAKQKAVPWSANFIHSNKIKSWLQLADFAIEQHRSLLYRPPIANRTLYQKLAFIERLGNIFFPFFGGEYVLFARAKVKPLTPIRLRWKQQLNGIRISTTISGHIARRSYPKGIQ